MPGRFFLAAQTWIAGISLKVQGYEVSFIPEERVHFPASVRQSYDSVSFGYPNGEAGYEGFGTWKGSYDRIFRRYVQNAAGCCIRKKRQYP